MDDSVLGLLHIQIQLFTISSSNLPSPTCVALLWPLVLNFSIVPPTVAFRLSKLSENGGRKWEWS